MGKEIEVLNRFYRELSQNMELEGKLKENSVFLSFLKIRSNNRLKLLEDSAINPGIVPKEVLSSLLSSGLIRQTDKINNYVVTAKGVWEIEKNSLGPDKLISWIDEEYFNQYHSSDKPLTDQEKVVLFSMIAIRSFSKTSAINLKKGGGMLETWGRVLEEANEKLKELNIISELKKDDLYGGFENETKVSGLFRRLTNLPKKTKGLYFSGGNSLYFLELSKEGKINKENLSYLLKQIWGGKKLSSKEVEEVYNYLCTTASKMSIYVFDLTGRVFSKPIYDSEVKDSLYNSI